MYKGNLKKAAMILTSESDEVYEGILYEYRKSFLELMYVAGGVPASVLKTIEE